jgi:GTP cyclohydrolase I
MGAQIADALIEDGGARGATVILEAEHLCLRLRGARSPEAAMRTVTHRGLFTEDAVLRQEVMAALQPR